MRPRIIKALATALGLYEMGLSSYLHSIDYPTMIYEYPRCPDSPFATCTPPIPIKMIPPPWYASLWPEALALGLALLIVPWVREMPSLARVAFRAMKVAYRKWEEWDSGGRSFP